MATITIGKKVACNVPNELVKSYAQRYLDLMRTGKMEWQEMIVSYSGKVFLIKETQGKAVLRYVKTQEPRFVKTGNIIKPVQPIELPVTKRKSTCEGFTIGLSRSKNHNSLATVFVQVNAQIPYQLSLCVECARKHREYSSGSYNMGLFRTLSSGMSRKDLDSLPDVKI